jgi:large subunit ribosomal protein L13
MTTYSAKPADIEKQWFIVDATDLVLGRMSAVIATYLRGKHKPTFTPHMDCGDNIIVINSDQVAISGDLTQDIEQWHTGFPGGVRGASRADLMEKDSARVVKECVRRMLPKGPLGRKMLTNLRVYPDGDHPHESVSPTELDIASMNDKNIRAA